MSQHVAESVSNPSLVVDSLKKDIDDMLLLPADSVLTRGKGYDKAKLSKMCDYLQIIKGNKDKDKEKLYQAIVQNMTDLKKMELAQSNNFFVRTELGHPKNGQQRSRIPVPGKT